MTIPTNPIVRTVLTVIGFGLLGAAATPQFVAFAPYLSAAGLGLLGALHVNLPTTKAGA